VWYVVAAILATQVAISWNLVLMEALVFRDRREAMSLGRRARRYFTINNLDTVIRMPLLVVLVETVGLRPSPANLSLIVAASGIKYVAVSKVVYRPLGASAPAGVSSTAASTTMRPVCSNVGQPGHLHGSVGNRVPTRLLTPLPVSTCACMPASSTRSGITE
jgi:hypothetical protein